MVYCNKVFYKLTEVNMNGKLSTALFAAAFLSHTVFAAERIETLHLDAIAVPRRWSPAESSVTLAPFKFSSRPVLKWTAPIDHFSGEKKYPVGWPRMYMNNFSRTKPAIPSDWSKWDFFEFDVKMCLEGDPDNKNCIVTFMIASTHPRSNTSLRKMHDGELHSIKIPVSQITAPGKITSFGFSIAESNYKHGSKLTVHAGNFRLTRSSHCTIDKATMLTPAITGAAPSIKLRLHITGPGSDVARGVPFQLVYGKTNSVVREETLPVKRGDREVEIAIDELQLEPGNYTLNLFPADKTRKKSLSFKVLSSPYKVKK